MKNNKGFSLVELIVVIAIMAILAAVAVIGVSVYIPKAQQANDKQLVSDIEYALELHAQSTPENVAAGYIILTPTGAQATPGFATDVLIATYGNDWADELKLSYDGWNSTFQDSSFASDEQGLTVLLGTVEDLTDALSGFLSNEGLASALGTGFNEYMAEMGATTAEQKADAAVFYVADKTAGLSSDSLQNAANAIVANQNQGSMAVMNAMNAELGSTMASAATMYALAEGYATYYDANYETPDGQDSPRDILDAATANIKTESESGSYADTAAAFNALLTAFQTMGAVNPSALEAYMAQNNGVSPMVQDMNAFSDAMKTVSASKDSILANNGNLGSDDYFTSDYIQGLVSSYSEGGIFVYVKVENSGLKISTSIDAEQ